MTGATHADGAAGWYGKLPSLGDFASRRLPPDFIERWDQWLARGLADWQARDPGWLQRYLQGPSWRFLLGPGVIDASAWTGVLMPSVDQVGRYFPLCIATSRDRLPDDARTLQSLLDWLLHLDDLALDAMQDDWPIETFEAELQRVGRWPGAAADFASPLAERIADALSTPEPAGRTLWIGRDGPGAPLLHQCPGLPEPQVVSALLAGQLPDRPTTNEGPP